MHGTIVGGGRPGRRQGRVRIPWLAIVLLLSTSPSAWADAQIEKFSGDTPMRADALGTSEFDAIVAEAQSVAQAPRSTSVVPLPAHWKTLDAGKLVAMMRMPAFVEIPESTRGVLLDQAATWDLLEFRRPSDAAVLWERLWPRAAGADPKKAPNGSDGIGYLPDPTWSTTARAMSTIFACFPGVAWSGAEDPAVFALRNPDAWQWRNDAGWDGFRRCVPQGAFFDDTRPDKAGTQALLELLRTKFRAELIEDRCSRPGPDSCLLLFQALFSLDQSDPELPRVLKGMAPSFHLDQAIGLPATSEALDAAETEVLRRMVFLTLKLPVLLRYPGAWPVGERERTFVQATELTVLFARLEQRNTARHQMFDRYYSSPWQWVDATQDASLADTQRRLGVDAARKDACALGTLPADEGIPFFWQGYALENIRLGHGDCERFDDLRLAHEYQAATKSHASMDLFQSIAATLMQPGPLHDRALDAMKETCATQRHATTRDPWQLCASVKARDAERAAIERQRIAAERASQPPVDPLACEDGTIARAADALGFGAGADFWSEWNAACRLDPSNAGHAIVALTYHPGEEQTGEARDDTDTDYLRDLDIVVLDLAHDAVLAHRHEAGAIPSDAIRFEGLSIDTGRYVLAPGKRAFGVRTSHSAHCYQCAYGDSDLALYLREGKRIQPLLQVRVGETRNAETPACPDAITESATEIDVGPGMQHGLADLSLRTTINTSANGEDAPVSCEPPQTETVRARFDGHAYQLPPAAADAR